MDPFAHQRARAIIDAAQTAAMQQRDLQWQQHMAQQAQVQQQQAQAAQQQALARLSERIGHAQDMYGTRRYHPPGNARVEKIEKLGRDLQLAYGLRPSEETLVTMAADPALMMVAEDALGRCAARREELETAPQRAEEARSGRTALVGRSGLPIRRHRQVRV